MKIYARLAVLLAAVFTADAALSQAKEVPEAQAAAGGEDEAPSVEHCWPTRNVGIAETSKDYDASCKEQKKEGDTKPQ